MKVPVPPCCQETILTVEGEKDYLLEIASNTFISPAARHHEEVRDGRPLSHICKLGGVSDRFGDFYGSLICSTGQNRCKNLGKNGKKRKFGQQTYHQYFQACAYAPSGGIECEGGADVEC